MLLRYNQGNIFGYAFGALVITLNTPVQLGDLSGTSVVPFHGMKAVVALTLAAIGGPLLESVLWPWSHCCQSSPVGLGVV